MENQTMEQAQAVATDVFKSLFEQALKESNKEKIDAFMTELNPEERDQCYLILLGATQRRLEQLEFNQGFAQGALITIALTAVGIIGTKNIKTSLDKKKDQRRTETDLLITKYFEKEITREDLKASVNKKDRKYVNEMTNEKIFE